ncbi:MAG TPA: alpha/beta fold hydrolase [Rhodoglobus sp.]|nr:alpha/beta fold hydrolase [Rhodoglobus sp.]
MQLDESAIIWSTPERDRAGRPLIVLLHGLGSHEGDLFGLSPALPLDAVVASLRAPLREGPGWAWFPRAAPGAPDPDAVDDAAHAVLAWLDTLESGPVTLIGFSQGGALALQLLRLAPGRFAAVANLAGFLAPGFQDGDAELAASKPRVFWGRGTVDDVIPDSAITRTREWLPEHADATVRIYEDLGHGISNEELRDLVGFLRGPRA